VNAATEFLQRGESYIQQLRDELAFNNVNASGRLSASIKLEVRDTGFTIFEDNPNPYFYYPDQGRKPTDKRLTKGFTREDAIQWAKDKGIPQWDGVTEEQRGFLIWRKVHRRGFYTEGANDPPKGKLMTNKVFNAEAREFDRAMLQRLFRDMIITAIR